MNTPRYAAAAAKLLSKNLPTAGVAWGDAARGVATIERAMRQRARRRRLGIATACGAAAAAAALLLAIGHYGTLDRGTESVSINVSPAGKGAALGAGSGEQPLSAHAVLESGQHIETPLGGGASLQLSTGTAMDLAGLTAFRVDSQGAVQHFSLQRGELAAHVAKLHAGQRFIVATPDAEVEVRGTRFRLSVLEQGATCGAGTRTRLDVTEGVVQVRARGGETIDVRAGQSWPADCREEPAPSATPTSTVAAAPAQSTVAPHHSAPQVARLAPSAPSTAPALASERGSDLTPQNDLFSEAVSQKRSGNVSGALRTFDQLIARYPNAALAENALVERMRLLGGSSQGRAEARRYLQLYPHGFAAAEAQKLAGMP
jgi:hypothetical protein